MNRYPAIGIAIVRGALIYSSVCLAGVGGNPDGPLFRPGPGYAAIIVLEVSVLLDAVATRHAVKRAKAEGLRFTSLTEPTSIVNYLVAAFAFLVLLLLLAFGDWTPGWIAWPIRVVLLLAFLSQGLLAALARAEGLGLIYEFGFSLACISTSVVTGMAMWSLARIDMVLALVVLPAAVALAAAAIVGNKGLYRLAGDKR